MTVPAKRTYWTNPELDSPIVAANNEDRYAQQEERDKLLRRCSEEEANLIASYTSSGTHLPALDIDLPAALIPSSTPGHWHLYIEKELSWPQYKKLLEILAEVGILETGYVNASLKHGMTMLRKPGIFKSEPRKVQDVEGQRYVAELEHRIAELEEEKARLQSIIARTESASMTWG